MGRLAKLEDMLAAMSTGDPAGQSPQLAALAGRLAELQKAARDASETARSGIARFDGELSAIRTEAGRLAQRLDGLKGEVEERLKGAAKAADVGPLTTRLAALERELQTFLASEADRNANASRIVLTLELANLKRAIDRGERYADELARGEEGRRLRSTSRRWSATCWRACRRRAELAKSFRKAANAMLDAEAEPADATLVDRLLSGARSIVRVRKAGHAADDTSAEAVVGRMEAALEGRPPRRGAGQCQDAAAQGRAGRRGLGQEGRGAPGRRAGAGRRRGGARSPRSAGAGRRHGRAAMIRIVLFLRRRAGDRRRPATGSPIGPARSSSSGRATSPRPACSAPSSSCCCC